MDKEIVARFVAEHLLTDVDVMRRVVQSEGRGFAEKLHDAWNAFVTKIKSAFGEKTDAETKAQLDMLERGRAMLAEVPIMAVLELEPKNRKGLVMEQIRLISTYTRVYENEKRNLPKIQGTQDLINDSRILYVDPKKTEPMLGYVAIGCNCRSA